MKLLRETIPEDRVIMWLPGSGGYHITTKTAYDEVWVSQGWCLASWNDAEKAWAIPEPEDQQKQAVPEEVEAQAAEEEEVFTAEAPLPAEEEAGTEEETKAKTTRRTRKD